MNKSTGRLSAVTLAFSISIASIAADAYAQAEGLPDIQTQGDVSYTSGGVGQDESQAFKRETPHWPLAMLFSGTSGDYISGVRIDISGRGGEKVLEAISQGPFMLVKLPPGDYTVRAVYKDETQQKAIHVSGHADVAFRW